MSDRNNPPRKRIIGPIVVTLMCLAAAYFAWRSVVPPAPTLLSKSSQGIASAEFADGAWYWIEGMNSPGAHLVRATGSSIAGVASTEQVRSFSVGHGKIAWIAGDGKTWSISVEGIDGSARAGIWSGDREPSGLYLADDKLYWLEQVPAAVPESGPMPPLGPTLKVVSAPLAAGAAPTALGSIMEPVGRKILGIHDDRLYAAANRGAFKDITTVYEIPLKGGPSKRIIGEVGDHSALLSPDGTLYWTSPSREDAQPDKAVCVWRLGRDGKPEPIQDWLPSGGRLFASGPTLCYIDGSYSASAWPIGAPGGMPQSLPLPAGYRAVAVGNGEILLQPEGVDKTTPIYRTALP